MSLHIERSRATAHGGSGLTIVQRIIELHHGSIKIDSGSKNLVWVRITLPAGR